MRSLPGGFARLDRSDNPIRDILSYVTLFSLFRCHKNPLLIQTDTWV
jgi:hypothetical protein